MNNLSPEPIPTGDKDLFFQVQSFSLSDKGHRPNNEDFVAFFEPSDPQEREVSGCIYIVADGVGGASIGERASKYACEKVLYEYFQHPEIEPGERLKLVIAQVNREIFDYAENNGIRMATTIAVAVVLKNILIVANVGDSRVYLIHGNQVQQITLDHSIVGEIVHQGMMSEIEAQMSRLKNRLTRSVGGSKEVQVDVFNSIQLQSDDKILLCTDGLTRYALKEDLMRMTKGETSKEITIRMVDFANQRGGADNISVVLVLYHDRTN
jgi:protein phosphatase